MTLHIGKNIPTPTAGTQTYWDACHNHQLKIQRCSDCQHCQFYPRIICTQCMSERVEWVEVSGRATAVSYTVVARAVSKAYEMDVPYVVALVALDEGPTMMTNIIDCAPEQVHIGMVLEVCFEDWTDEITIPKFRPIAT